MAGNTLPRRVDSFAVQAAGRSTFQGISLAGRGVRKIFPNLLDGFGQRADKGQESSDSVVHQVNPSFMMNRWPMFDRRELQNGSGFRDHGSLRSAGEKNNLQP